MEENLFERYEKRMFLGREVFKRRMADVAKCTDERELALFLINFCSYGIEMTKDVFEWISNAAEHAQYKWPEVSRKLSAHAVHEKGHEKLFENDTVNLVNWYNHKFNEKFSIGKILKFKPNLEGIRLYQNLHKEHCFNSATPYAQVAIEYEIEKVSVEFGPMMLTQCDKILGREVLAHLSFVRDHVKFDVGHTKFNAEMLSELLVSNPETLDVLVMTGHRAIDAYACYVEGCLYEAKRMAQQAT